MKENEIVTIQQQINDSVNWVTKNSESMDFQRVEGTLKSKPFQIDLLDKLSRYEETLDKLTTSYACGFEIEFFLPPNKITALETSIANFLPDYQMLLICLDLVPKTNHRNFYLIQEKTGHPPEGMSSYEIVSPILDYKSLPYFLTHFFEILHEYGATDNDSIGFHLHISTIDNIKISPISLLYALDQQGVLKEPERKYSRDIINQLFKYDPKDWKWIFEEVSRKCYNVNLLHYANKNHIELRSMGGAGFLKTQETIIDNCFKALLAYEYAKNTAIDVIAKNIYNTYSLDHTALKTQNQDYQTLKTPNEKQTWYV